MIIFNLFILYYILFKIKHYCLIFPENQSLEDLWLFIPIIFLLFIGFPRIKNLYIFEEFKESDLIFKINGHQWFWSYEIININIKFDSIIKEENFSFRLIETFNQLIIPIKCIICLIITSEDVIHSWTIPSIGIKLDATPGRLSQSLIIILRPRIILGQCREICGVNHSFMPILISSISIKNFLK